MRILNVSKEDNVYFICVGEYFHPDEAKNGIEIIGDNGSLCITDKDHYQVCLNRGCFSEPNWTLVGTKDIDLSNLGEIKEVNILGKSK